MRGVWRILVVVCAAVAAACAPEQPPPRATSGPRIVSLSPALTRCVMDLGGGKFIVGRTPWCAATDAPVVGTLEDCDLARVAELRPTLILVQAGAADPALVRTAKDVDARLVVQHIDRVRDIEAAVDTLAVELTQAGVPEAMLRRSELSARAAAATAAARPALALAGPTLILFSADPPTAFGAETYVDDLWRSAGGTNAVARPGYPELTLEDIVRLDPALVLLVRAAGGPMPRTLEALPDRLRRRIRVAVAPELLEPSTRFLTDGPAALAAAAGGPHR